jgi:ferrous iron transport protein B
MPQAYNVVFRAYEASKDFMVRAGTVIFAMSILIWFLSYFPRSESVKTNIASQYDDRIQLIESKMNDASDSEKEELESKLEGIQSEMNAMISATYLEQSYLGRAGTYIQPVFQPLGFDWRLSVGVLSAFPAREVIVSTLGIIFNVGEEANEESESLKNQLRNARDMNGALLYSSLTAVTLMIFFALSSQCMSTLAIVKRELNSWSWTFGLFVYMTLLAYIVAFVARQIGLLLGFE